MGSCTPRSMTVKKFVVITRLKMYKTKICRVVIPGLYLKRLTAHSRIQSLRLYTEGPPPREIEGCSG